MLRSVFISLPDDAAERLRDLAHREHRNLRQQATVLVLDGLKRADRPSSRQKAVRPPTPDREAA